MEGPSRLVFARTQVAPRTRGVACDREPECPATALFSPGTTCIMSQLASVQVSAEINAGLSILGFADDRHVPLPLSPLPPSLPIPSLPPSFWTLSSSPSSLFSQFVLLDPPLRASRVLNSSPPGVLPLLQLLASHARPHRDNMSFLLPFFPPPSPGCVLPGAPLRIWRGIRDKRPILPLSRPLAVSLSAIFQPAFCSSRRPGLRKRPSHLSSAPFLFLAAKRSTPEMLFSRSEP